MAYKPSQRPQPNIKIIFASPIEPTFLQQQTELHFSAVPLHEFGRCNSSLGGKKPTLKAEGAWGLKRWRRRKELLELKAKFFVIDGDQIEVLCNWKGGGKIQL